MTLLPEPMIHAVRPIGYVVTSYSPVARPPLQSARNDEPAHILIDEMFTPGLADLDGFDYAWVLTWLDRTGAVDLTPEPLPLAGSGLRFGIFATRAPARPNPIGLSLVRLVAVHGDRVDFNGVDLFDQTPVIDIKPWVPELDSPGYELRRVDLDQVRTGWYAEHGVF